MTKFDRDTQIMYLFSFRYALGRGSTAPEIVTGYLLGKLKRFSNYNITIMLKEVTEFLEKKSPLEMHAHAWETLKIQLERELERRKK